MIITRFAPSPTGSLHIGGARTALFNFLYARRMGGEFLLRIEDTDQQRNDPSVIQPIFDALSWLDIYHDREPVFQSSLLDRHRDVAIDLVSRGAAYFCRMTPEEVESQRTLDRKSGKAFRSRYRDAALSMGVVRLRSPDEGETIVDDLVQGRVKVRNETLDDLVILRADGTPTYMLASVVDDHDMGVSLVGRGDDHLNNTFRQRAILTGMEWDIPAYAHLPLLHGEDGKKLSKRENAAGLEFYRDAGYLPETIINYLLRMGWGHGNQEFFSLSEGIRLFDFSAVGRNPAKLNQKKLDSLNGHYIREMSEEAFANAMGREVDDLTPLIRERAKTLREAETLVAMVENRPEFDGDLAESMWIAMALPEDFTPKAIKTSMVELAERLDMKLGDIAKILRLRIMGEPHTPPLFEVMAYLGRAEVLTRLTGVVDMATTTDAADEYIAIETLWRKS